MAADFEIRFKVKDSQWLGEKIKSLGGKLIVEYEYTDHYFHPLAGKWDPQTQVLRIRHQMVPPKPVVVYYSKTKMARIGEYLFKKSLYPSPKLELAKGDLPFCLEVVKDLGFKKWFCIVKKGGKYFDLGEYRVAYEYVKGLGWLGQLEMMVANAKTVKSKLDILINTLKIDEKSLSFEPLGSYYRKIKNLV
jgi:predicted adenylyl cyclase CyaB